MAAQALGRAQNLSGRDPGHACYAVHTVPPGKATTVKDIGAASARGEPFDVNKLSTGRYEMPKFLIKGSYTAEGLKGLTKDKVLVMR